MAASEFTRGNEAGSLHTTQYKPEDHMKRILFSAAKVFAYLSIIFITLAGTATVEAEWNTKAGLDLFNLSYQPVQPLRFSEQAKFGGGGRPILVFDVEGLYSAVNDTQNSGRQVALAPGVYYLSVNGPGGVPRPNGGRLELQADMSLIGVVDDRTTVVIDAINLPASSYSAPPIPLTGAVRMGRGSNSIEWLTVRNAVNGNANIGTELVSTGTVYIRVADVASTNSQRGMDLRNFGAAGAGRVIEAEIVDNDFYDNRIGTLGEGLRIVNNNGANGGRISARLAGNRSYNNYLGLIVEDNRSNNANISVVSLNDRFFENGLGALVGGGLSSGTAPANGNTVNFTAYGSSFENNNGFNNLDFGGLIIIGGENTSIPNGTSNNTVNVELRGCRLANNQLYDLAAFGARSKPLSAGLPGTNNRVTIAGFGPRRGVNVVTSDSIPDYPGGMNSVTFIQ